MSVVEHENLESKKLKNETLTVKDFEANQAISKLIYQYCSFVVSNAQVI